MHTMQYNCIQAENRRLPILSQNRKQSAKTQLTLALFSPVFSIFSARQTEIEVKFQYVNVFPSTGAS